VLLEWRWNGQTVGKRLLDLRVIDERGFSIDFFQAFTRNLLRAVDLLPFFYGVGGVTGLCNPRQKRLGDFAAGTLVVKVRRRVMPAAIMAPNEKYNTLQENAALRVRIRAELSLEERDLLLQLCVRRHELGLESRQALFEETAAYLEERLDLQREPFLSPEKFVQNIAAIALAEAPVRRAPVVPERVGGN
jgi:RDD family